MRIRGLAVAAVMILGCTKAKEVEKGKEGWTAEGAKWAELMLSELPKQACTDGGFFRACFTVTQQECETQMHEALDHCLHLTPNEVPKVMTLEEGKRAGGLFGGCAGMKYQQELSAAGKFHDTSHCNDPGAWTHN